MVHQQPTHQGTSACHPVLQAQHQDRPPLLSMLACMCRRHQAGRCAGWSVGYQCGTILVLQDPHESTSAYDIEAHSLPGGLAECTTSAGTHRMGQGACLHDAHGGHEAGQPRGAAAETQHSIRSSPALLTRPPGKWGMVPGVCEGVCST